MPKAFSKTEIDQLVADVVRQAEKYNPRRAYDPIDYLGQLMNVARQLPGACAEPQYSGEPLEKRPLDKYLTAAADTLFEINPTVTWQSWRALVYGVLHAKHANTKMRFRKRPALGPRVDATEGRMSYEQLKAKHPHLSRRRLYQFIEEANKVK